MPWPDDDIRIHLLLPMDLLLTSLGEEGAEALVRVGGFALGSQVTIGLSLG